MPQFNLGWFRLIIVLAGVFYAHGVSAQAAQSDPNASATSIEEMVVEATRSIHAQLGDTGSKSILLEEEIELIGATHVNETLARVPGVWISRGSGQEHLAGIRSGIFTGSGACGEFSYLENGVPIRPAGFCNVNNLFEVNTEQAAAIEVWRGPASAILGGNALHGAINVVTPVRLERGISVEGGPYDFYRLQAWGGVALENHTMTASVVGTSSDGYRDDTGYGQQKLQISHATQIGDWRVENHFSGTLLNQETGGFVGGFEAFEDGDLRDSNPNPEAYRDAWSLRLTSVWTKDDWSVKPYLRKSDMEFLQHFLPGQPLEENEQSSLGVIVTRNLGGDTVQAQVGGHVEYMTGSLREFQDGPTVGSAFLVATRPEGLHYDYDVDSVMAAGFYHLNVNLSENGRFIHSLRVEHLAYDYDNNTLVGNTRDDGTPCGFGGCLYSRPASSDNDFTNVGIRLGFEADYGDNLLYGSVSTGFRPPQVTELYRLRGGQTVADLDSEELVALEAGFKTPRYALALFRETTRNLILRDSEGFNVSNGETESYGVELETTLAWDNHELALAASYAIHEYAFDSLLGGGEIITDGNEVDTAPRFLGNLTWSTRFSEKLSHELELNVVGSHYVNAANTAEYDGHFVVNWRAQYQLNERTQISARLINLLDERYADRADFAFGSYRYFPGMPRQLYLGVRYDFN